MKSSWHKRYTVSNNLNATNDVLAAIVDSGIDVHLVHLGTMGVYGYGTAGMKIPEGYLKVKVGEDGREVEKALEYFPRCDAALVQLSRLSSRRGDRGQALHFIDEALTNLPDTEQFHKRRAEYVKFRKKLIPVLQ